MNLYDQLKDHPRFPKKFLEEYEKIHFTSGSQGWDSHTFGLKCKLEGFDERLEQFIEFLKSFEVDKEKVQKILFQEMEPVLCEKTKKGEWILKDPSKLAASICKENIIGDKK